MEPIQKVIQDSSQLWNILLYLIWPAIVGSYAFTWKMILWLRNEIREATRLALEATQVAETIRDNELKHIERRLNDLEGKK